MMLETTSIEPLTQILAAVAAHFVWQGFALGAAAACLLHAIGHSPRTRYAIHCLLLIALATAPIVTCWVVAPRAGAHAVRAMVRSAGDGVIATDGEVAPVDRLDDAFAAPLVEAALGQWRTILRERQSLIVALWAAGTTLMITRLAIAAIGLASILRRRQPIGAELADTVERLARRISLASLPAVYSVERLTQAMAVGIFRPLVLLPAAWIVELPPGVLEAVIAHELAHLRRWDPVINLAQRLIEATLFFHPVVWWCSRRLRIEREMCCDELAHAALGNRLAYASALTYLAHRQAGSMPPVLALGVGGPRMVLLQRVRHVLGLAVPRGRLHGAGWAVLGAIVTSLAWAAAIGLLEPSRHSPDKIEQPEPTNLARDEVRSAPPLPLGVRQPPRAKIPSERAKVLLPDYTIEPPDVLFIEALRVVPKAPYHIHTGDELSILFEPNDPSLVHSGRGYFVDPEGRVDLGPRLGKVKVSGMTVDEASASVLETLKTELREPRVSISTVQTSGMQPITGEHLVSPDGFVTLGMYGRVKVAGMTLDEARSAVEEHLAAYLDDPQVSLSVFAYNSKVYYVLVQGGPNGDQVTRLPVTGGETVLDALAAVTGLSDLAKKEIWIARPHPGGEARDVILRVNWNEITRGASTESNYQVMPGDRIFVADPGHHVPRKAGVAQPASYYVGQSH